MHALLALPLLAALASARMQHVRRSGSADQHCRLASRLNNDTSDADGSGAKNTTVAAAWLEGWNANYTASDVSWDKYTHVTYSFAVTQPDGSVDLSGSGGEAGLQAFVAAARNSSTKALLSVGGWTGSLYWSSAVGSAANRTAFVQTLSKLVTDYGLDGLDFDWEYPVTGGMACNTNTPQDTDNFLLFLQELRQLNSSLTMTAAAGIAPWKDATGTPSTNVSGFAEVLDYVAIMNYDEYGQWSTTAGPNSALNDSCVADASQAAGSAVSAVAAWTAAGFPASQLVLGVASYGHAFNVTAAQAFASSPNAADDCDAELEVFPAYSKWALAAGEAQPTECGAPAAKDVQYTFAGLVAAGLLDKAGNATDAVDYRFDECSRTPVLYAEDLGTFVSFDDAASFAAKGAYIKDAGLLGFAMWEASGDYEDILLDSIRGALELS